MRTGAGHQQRWRKKGKRAVSPIIATILLVAITVVLAAVLYVLISGLIKGPGNTPIGSALAVGTATGGVCAGSPQICTYTFSIQQASSGINGNNLKFQLQGSGNNITSYAYVELKDSTGCVIGTYSAAAAWAAAPGPGTACGAAPTLATPLTSGDQLVLSTGAKISAQGYQLIVVGTGSFSGSVTGAIP